MNLLMKRRLQLLRYGLRDSKEIAHAIKSSGKQVSRWWIFFDIVRHFWKYHLFSNQYKAERLWELDSAKKEETARRIGDANLRRDMVIVNWWPKYFGNFRFLQKYSSMKYDVSNSATLKRIAAYCKRYNMGKNCWVQYGVTIISEHFSDAEIHIGNKCLLARNCDLDYTGGLTIGNNVGILEGAKVLTHAHDTMNAVDPSMYIPYSNKAYKTPLIIGDNVTIAVHAIILPGVGSIGSNCRIQAGAIVSKPVPPNTLVLASGKFIKIPTWVNTSKE